MRAGLLKGAALASAVAFLASSSAMAAPQYWDGWHDMTQSGMAGEQSRYFLEKLIGPIMDLEPILSHPNGFSLLLTEIDLNGDGEYEYRWTLGSDAICIEFECRRSGISGADGRLLTPADDMLSGFNAYHDQSTEGWRDIEDADGDIFRWNGERYVQDDEVGARTVYTPQDLQTLVTEVSSPWESRVADLYGVSTSASFVRLEGTSLVGFYCREGRPRAFVNDSAVPHPNELVFLHTGVRAFYSRFSHDEEQGVELDLSPVAGRAAINAAYNLIVAVGNQSWSLPMEGARAALSYALETCSAPTEPGFIAEITTIPLDLPRDMVERLDAHIGETGNRYTRDQAVLRILEKWAAEKDAADGQ